MSATGTSHPTSVDQAELDKFTAMAAEWWDPAGKFKPLHKFNPVRLRYIREKTCTHFGLDAELRRPLEGLSLVDIGCGGGLLCEPMARLGASVTGIDPGQENISVAKNHANPQGLDIDYQAISAEELLETGKTYDIVLNMEVVEHVADMALFMGSCAGLVNPGGLLFSATLNRTLKSFAFAIIGAEYVLRWLPRGTHQWEKFVTPAELGKAITGAGLELSHTQGVIFNPLSDKWQVSPDTDVNYMMLAQNPHVRHSRAGGNPLLSVGK